MINPKEMCDIFTDDVLDILPSNANLKRSAAMYERSQNPEWRNNVKNANKIIGQNNFNNPIWRQNRQDGFLRISKTDEYRKKRKELQNSNIENSEYIEKVRNGVNAWLSTDEGKIKKQEAINKRKLWILDIENNLLYDGIKDISKAYKIHPDTFRKRYLRAHPEKFLQLDYLKAKEWKENNF